MRDPNVRLQLLATGMTVLLCGAPASAQPPDDKAAPNDPGTEVADEAAPSGESQAADGDVRRPEGSGAQEIAAGSWDDNWFDQAEPEASATDVSPPRHSPLEVEASAGNLSRSFAYSEDLTNALRSYSAPSGLLLAGDLAWFPAAHFTSQAPAHLGLTGHFALGLPQSTAEGIGASAMQWRAGLVGRVPFAGGRLAPEGLVLGRVEGGQHRFVVDADPSGATLIPGVEYDYLRVALGARLNLSQRVLVELEAGARFPFDEGEIAGPEWFPRAQATGLDGRLRLGASFGPVDVLLGAAHERYFFSFDPTPEGPNPAGVAAGATDEYWAFTLGVRFSLPPAGT
jgi:hypothetical protein